MCSLEEVIREIQPADQSICVAAREKWDKIAKPLRSLGKLEEMVIQLAGATGELNPEVKKKAVLIFCADNGVVEEGVTQTGSEVTALVTENFTKGIATVNSFATVAGARTIPIDIGVNRDLSKVKGLEHKKVAWGTQNIAQGPAMTREQCRQAIMVGVEMVRKYKEEGYQLFVTGEMGIGNTSTSSAILSVLTGVPVAKVTGKGAGLSQDGVKHKIAVLEQAVAVNQPDKTDIWDVMTKLGGFDICGMAGAFLGGALYHVPVFIDGFISAIAALCAVRLAPACKDYMFASHCSAEPAGQLTLQTLGLEACIHGELCLGEGTGGLLGAKLLDFALAAYQEVAEFEQLDMKPYELLD